MVRLQETRGRHTLRLQLQFIIVTMSSGVMVVQCLPCPHLRNKEDFPTGYIMTRDLDGMVSQLYDLFSTLYLPTYTISPVAGPELVTNS